MPKKKAEPQNVEATEAVEKETAAVEETPKKGRSRAKKVAEEAPAEKAEETVTEADQGRENIGEGLPDATELLSKSETDAPEQPKPLSQEEPKITQQEALNMFESMLSKMFDKRRTQAATREERRELYRDAERAVQIDGFRAESDADKKRNEIRRLMTAAQSVPPQILRGSVIGFHKTSEDGTWVIDVQEKDSEGNVRILIPIDQFMTNHKEYAEERFLVNELQGRINSDVDFIIYQVVEKDGLAAASRIAAQEQKIYRNFIRPMEDEVPRICDGMIVPATVISVRRDRVRVDISGAEAVIKSEDLSWTALNSIEKEFKVGDVFNVKVSEIKTVEYKTAQRTYRLLSLRASKREAEPDPREKYFDQFEQGQFCGGEVKAFTDNGLIFVRVADKMDCLCRAPQSGTPARGDKVIVLIQEKNPEEKRLYGVIKSL